MARDPEFLNLENKTDVQLRSLMRKAGIPVTPLTDSTRKYVISKLKRFGETGSAASPPATKSQKITAASKAKAAAAVLSSDDDDATTTVSPHHSQQQLNNKKKQQSQQQPASSQYRHQMQSDSESDVSSSATGGDSGGGSKRRVSPRRNGSAATATTTNDFNTASAKYPPPQSSQRPPAGGAIAGVVLPKSTVMMQSPVHATARTNANNNTYSSLSAGNSTTSGGLLISGSEQDDDDEMIVDEESYEEMRNEQLKVPSIHPPASTFHMTSSSSSRPKTPESAAAVAFSKSNISTRSMMPPATPSKAAVGNSILPRPAAAPTTQQHASTTFADTVDNAVKHVRQRLGLPPVPAPASPPGSAGSSSSKDQRWYHRTIAQSPPRIGLRNERPELSQIYSSSDEDENDDIATAKNFNNRRSTNNNLQYKVEYDKEPLLQRLFNYFDRNVPTSGILAVLLVLLIVAFAMFAVDFASLLQQFSSNNATNQTNKYLPSSLNPLALIHSGIDKLHADDYDAAPRVEPIFPGQDLIPVCDDDDGGNVEGKLLHKSSDRVPAHFPFSKKPDANLAVTKPKFCLTTADAADALQVARIMLHDLRQLRGDRECEQASKHEYYKDKLELAENLQRQFAIRSRKSLSRDEFDNSMLHNALLLAQINPHWQIECVDGAGNQPQDYSNCFRIQSKVATKTLLCRIHSIFRRVYYVALIGISSLVGFCVLYYFLREYRRMQHAQREHKMQLVEKIITLLRNNRQQGQTGGMPVNHIRDMLVPHRDRTLQRLKLFNDAYRYVLANDSRVHMKETMVVGGEPSQVLFWTGAAVAAAPAGNNDTIDAGGNTSRSPARRRANDETTFSGSSDEEDEIIRQLDKSGSSPMPPTVAPLYANSRDGMQRRGHHGRFWQGNAFAAERTLRTDFPSDCIKIRGMFDGTNEDQSQHGSLAWVQEIKDAVLDKCIAGNARVTHLYVDPRSPEGIVLMMCASRTDAGRAYQALHGNWFDSGLVSLKYLRTQQYLERFPEAAYAKTALMPSAAGANKSMRALMTTQHPINAGGATGGSVSGAMSPSLLHQQNQQMKY